MKFFIKNYGCQMNLYDSSRMTDVLCMSGYELVQDICDAEIAIFNTCSIREKANEKLFSDLGRAKSRKFAAHQDGKKFLIIVTGCVAQAHAQELQRRASYVDIILGPQDIHGIADCIHNITADGNVDESTFNNNCITVQTNLNANNKFAHLPDNFFRRGVSEFLTIQEGCNNFCSYCCVPHTRGREYSRDVEDVLAEARRLTAMGVKEIVLLGQNVNSYAGQGPDAKIWNLARLLYTIAELNGLVRMRYTTSNPKDVTAELAKVHREVPILAPSVHLPAQSGSDRILARMNRRYSVDDYYRCVDVLMENRPDMVLTSDFIVGFPGETDDDFEKTMRFVEKIKFANAYSFKYSPRANTAAAKMDDQIPESVKSERLKALQRVLLEHQKQFNKNSVGKTVQVLFVKEGNHKNQSVGRSEYSQAVSVCDNSIGVGDLCNVKIVKTVSHSVIGMVV
ncbi:MAG: tRNA (N6-isopentenyl adenosine(37)-C2)-methylthiotransferase MiaB [Holosporaceae bacterium]|jgi:tRNA-2-methylthio-N6-dimethylallyladenosine synthase|nr:tRNA (N6-isopentenyl adenosine(37)-C2)-methylthiotransferase MiaB [Holosporaceae bacterium]